MACRLARTDKEYGMDDLSKLGLKYGTDKIGKHNYLPVYYDLFKDRRNEVKKVLEIGVGEGKGVRMFRDFFPNAMIFGLEIDKSRLFIEDRIEVTLCDQSNKEDLLYGFGCIGGNIDLVIDDGSHRTSDQFFSAVVLVPLLKEGSIYVIEDVHEQKSLEDMLNTHFEFIPEITLIKCGNRYDDNLIIIKK